LHQNFHNLCGSTSVVWCPQLLWNVIYIYTRKYSRFILHWTRDCNVERQNLSTFFTFSPCGMRQSLQSTRLQDFMDRHWLPKKALHFSGRKPQNIGSVVKTLEQSTSPVYWLIATELVLRLGGEYYITYITVCI
jgi:hypothetical protein